MLHRFSITTNLRYRFGQQGWLLLNVAVTKNSHQRILSETWECGSGVLVKEQSTAEGAPRFHGLSAQAGILDICYHVELEREIQAEGKAWSPPETALIDLPPEVARYLYPSRYCESDKLVRLAAKEFGGLQPGHERVVGVCNWIHDHLDYLPASTDQHTSAADCLILRAGVCRDFAHLGVALCRALGIPARYGSAYAYALPTPDLHAFFEVWLGGQWWYYDATRLAPQHGFILVGTGHDAADTAVATMSLGVTCEAMSIQVDKLTPESIDYTIQPVTFYSTA